MAVSWITPKTDWNDADRFKNVDYNRIKNNIQYLFENGGDVWTAQIISMGANRTLDDISPFTPSFFNSVEDNIDNLNKSGSIKLNYLGEKKSFNYGDRFLDASELNRIENATLELKNLADRIAKSKRKLPFRFGTYKNIRL